MEVINGHSNDVYIIAKLGMNDLRILNPMQMSLKNLLIAARPELQLYPFGTEAGDTINPRSLDGGSRSVSLRFGRLPYFGSSYQTIYVSFRLSVLNFKND